MALTPSTMLSLGTIAPDFELPDLNGKKVSLANFTDNKLLLVVFMCNHCPYVKHIITHFVDFANEYQQKDVAIVAINSNDVKNYPDDSPDNMIKFAALSGIAFPYLFDESQEVAKAYKAACTPDFFLFDSNRKLVYRGQFDDSRPGNNNPVTGYDLKNAIEQTLNNQKIDDNQKPSLGCNIKWKQGNAPDYFK